MVGGSEPASVGETTWGPYRPLFRFAAGGMAEIWAAAKSGLAGFEKIVAVKRMLPQLEDDRFVTMFLDEAHLAAHVRSPHVVSTLDLGRADDGSLYIAMELVNGVSLSQLMRALRAAEEPLPIPAAVEILAQACRGLHDAHEATAPDGRALHIVHRDVSPQNLLVDRSGLVRITDFGVASAVERFTQTQTGELRGKLSYLSPEQANSRDVDRRTDVFALGVVAHELLAGAPLFRRENAFLTIHAVLTAEVPPLDGVPPELEAVVRKALERDPEARWQSAHAFGEALLAALPRSGADAVGALVATHAGEFIESLESRLRDAYQSGPTRLERSPGSVRDLVDGDARSHARLVGGADRDEGTTRAEGLRTPDAAAPEGAAAHAGDGRASGLVSKAKWILVGGLVAAVSGWIVAGVWLGPADEPTAPPAEVEAPVVEGTAAERTRPSPEPPAADEPSAEASETVVEAPDEAEGPPAPSGTPDAPSATRGSSDADGAPARRRVGARAPRRPAATPRGESSPRAESAPTAPSPREPAPAPTSAATEPERPASEEPAGAGERPAQPSSSSSGGILFGSDAFESDVGGGSR